jgi:hypothetical protein
MISWLQNHLSTCFFVKYFGIECPSCGMQRALIALLKGEFSDSLQYNPALIPFLASILMLIFHLVFKLKHGARILIILFSITSATMILNYVHKEIYNWQHDSNRKHF